MNTKMKTFLTTLSLILATSASAQVASILPGGRGNIYIGTPMNLPGPVSSVVISPRINLPAPLLTPAISATLAPVPVVMAAAIPAQLPTPVIPVAPTKPDLPISALPDHLWKLENVTISYPALRAKFAASAADNTPKDAAAEREALENLFDGRKQPSEKSPIRSDRHQSLPEQDLESEIGAY